jgi:hypothetical protein
MPGAQRSVAQVILCTMMIFDQKKFQVLRIPWAEKASGDFYFTSYPLVRLVGPKYLAFNQER